MGAGDPAPVAPAPIGLPVAAPLVPDDAGTLLDADCVDAVVEPVDVEAPEPAGPFDPGGPEDAELVGDLDPELPESAPAGPAPPKVKAASPTAAPTKTAVSRDGLSIESTPPGDQFS